MIKCNVCEKEFKNINWLGKHLSKHQMIMEQYVLKFKYNNIHPLCKCGCGKITNFKKSGLCDFLPALVGHKTKEEREEIQKKIEATNLNNFGVKYGWQRRDVVDKISIKKYGIPCQNKTKDKKLYNKQHYENNKEELKLNQRNYYESHKEQVSLSNKKYREIHKKDLQFKKKQYYENNRKNLLKRQKVYYENNKQDVIDYGKKYRKEKFKNDIQFRIAENLRHRLYGAVIGNYKSGSAVADLMMSIADFKIYLEERFYPNPDTGEMMSWENYGFYGWHIDHIIPLSAFDLTKREELLKAVHYSNLRPMWAKRNMSEGSRGMSRNKKKKENGVSI